MRSQDFLKIGYFYLWHILTVYALHRGGRILAKLCWTFLEESADTKVFREIGLAGELGSGMRSAYKYTKMYSGGEPQFVKGDVFRITIPLKGAATATEGPDSNLAAGKRYAVI